MYKRSERKSSGRSQKSPIPESEKELKGLLQRKSSEPPAQCTNPVKTTRRTQNTKSKSHVQFSSFQSDDQLYDNLITEAQTNEETKPFQRDGSLKLNKALHPDVQEIAKVVITAIYYFI